MNNRWFFTVFSKAVIFFLLGWQSSFAQKLTDGDPQLWTTFAVEGSLAKKLKVGFEKELRIGDGINDLYYLHAEANVAYGFKNFSLGAGYRQVYEQKKGTWREENRPVGFVILNTKWRGVSFSDRSRLEYRSREAASAMWRYRNKLTVTFPSVWTKIKLQPFLSDEIFLDMSTGEVHRNRVFAGIQHQLGNKHFKMETFYLLQTSRKSTGSSEWINFHVAGTKLKYEF